MNRLVTLWHSRVVKPSSLCRFLSHFRVVDHIVPCSYTRGRPGAVEPGHECDLRLAVKQYIPLRSRTDSPSSCSPDDATIIGGHANGFPKELFDPLWDDLYEQLRSRGQGIRSIWIADIVQQGESGVLNEQILGDDTDWWDHARDLLFLINQKQKEMPQPLIGIGHSMGASHLAALALLHPNLLQSLVLIDPVIQIENPSLEFAPASTHRREVWPSRAEADAAFKKSKFYQSWDTRVLEKWLHYGLRDLPTKLYPDVNDKEPATAHSHGEHLSRESRLHDNIDEQVHQVQSIPPNDHPQDPATSLTSSSDDPAQTNPVTLTTAKLQELIHYLRPLYHLDTLPTPPSNSLTRHFYPDINPADPPFTSTSTTNTNSDTANTHPPPPSILTSFYRPEPPSIFRLLPHLRPRTHYIFGAHSPLATPSLRTQKMATTGVGVGGSRGPTLTSTPGNPTATTENIDADDDAVTQTLLPTGHLVAFEAPGDVAAHAAGKIADEVRRWRAVRDEWTSQVWGKRQGAQRGVVDDEWVRRIGERPARDQGKAKGGGGSREGDVREYEMLFSWR